MSRYIPNTENDTREMLETINVHSIEELFQDIPSGIRLNRRLALEKPLSELEVTKIVGSLANKNLSTDNLVCFLGAGAYDHYIPSIIKHITSRSEFYTSYTPYQPEISQGTLQYIFEYQSMICNLTGMDVANASMYDGATAVTEAAMMTLDGKKKKVIISSTVHPETRENLKTYMRFRNIEVCEINASEGVTDIEHLRSSVDPSTACVIVQTPNFLGFCEDMNEIEKITHGNKSLFIANVDPISLGIMASPAEYGADIAVGEGQSLGNSLNYGGPYLGFLAAKSSLMRKMPGRIVGETTDVDGKRAFVLTLQAREQHIRREKANSNICSNQSLNALIAAIYLCTMGNQGLKEVATQCVQKAHYAYEKLLKTGIFKPISKSPFFKEFSLESSIDPDIVNQHLLKNGILGGFAIGTKYTNYPNGMLFCVTEKRSKEEIDNLVTVLEGLV